jgi:hypothetical protein
MPTLSNEIGRPGSAIKRSGEQKVIEVSFSSISRNRGGNLRSARNFQQTATEFPQGEPSWQNAELTLRHLRDAAGSMASAMPLDRWAPWRRWIDGRAFEAVYDGGNCPRLAARIRARGQSFYAVTAAQRAEHSQPEVGGR